MKFDNKLRATVLVCAVTFGASALLICTNPVFGW